MELKGDEQHIVTISAVRYAMGRSTYVPRMVCEFVARHADELDVCTRYVVAEDIREWLDGLERVPGWKPPHDCIECFRWLLGVLERGEG